MNIIWMIIFFLCQVRCEWIFFEHEIPGIYYVGVEEKIIALTRKAEEEEMRNRPYEEQKRKDKAMRRMIRKNEKYMKKYWNMEKIRLEMKNERKMAGYPNVPQVPYQFPGQPGHPCYPNYPPPVPNCPPQMPTAGHPAMHPGYPGYTVPVPCDSSTRHQPPVPICPQQIPQHPGPIPANPIPGNHLPIPQQQGAVPAGHLQMSHSTSPLPGYPPQMPCYPVPGNYPQQYQGASNHPVPGQHTSAPLPPYAAASSQNSNNCPCDNGNKDQKKDDKITPPVPMPRGIRK